MTKEPRLRDLNDLLGAEGLMLPPELVLAIGSDRPELVTLAKGRERSVEDADRLLDLIRALLVTNGALRRHAKALTKEIAGLVDKQEIDLIFDIVDKAWPTMEAMGWFYRNDVTLKVLLCHKLVYPLDLEAMRAGELLDLLHDVAGISRHFNVRTRQMEDCFVPRYATNQDVPA